LQDSVIVQLVINSTNYPYELSKRWNDEDRANTINRNIFDLTYEQFHQQILTQENAKEIIYYQSADENYKHEVEDVLIYLKLKKVKRLILMNEEDMKNPSSDAETIKQYQEVHIHLKTMQKELSGKKGTVMYPF
jgi:DNA primase